MNDLSNSKVAILTEMGFEEVELTSPMQALKQAGAKVQVVSPRKGSVRAFKEHKEWTIEIPVDKHISEANPDDFDALMLPGGVINPDLLRMNKEAVNFIKAFFSAEKPVAAICHGSQSMITAGVVRGRTMTSYPSIAIDLMNAGAHWVDKEVVVDHNLITSRSPADLNAFNEAMCKEFAEGMHAHH